MRIGVYVGSFDPIHKGHVAVMNYLLDNDYVDKIVLIPTGGYWDKHEMIDVYDRIKMCQYYQNDKIIVNDKLNNLPYTYLVLEKLTQEYMGDDLFLIVGADNMALFYKWKNVHEILKNKILVLPRDNIDTIKYINEFEEKNNFIMVKNFNMVKVSSTVIRNNIKEKKYDICLNYIDKDIMDYIILNKLYM